MNRLFSTMFDAPDGRGRVQRWIPSMDLVESEDEYVLRADLPGQQDAGDLADCDIDTVAARLEQAHDLLVQALAAVERG